MRVRVMLPKKEFWKLPKRGIIFLLKWFYTGIHLSLLVLSEEYTVLFSMNWHTLARLSENRSACNTHSVYEPMCEPLWRGKIQPPHRGPLHDFLPALSQNLREPCPKCVNASRFYSTLTQFSVHWALEEWGIDGTTAANLISNIKQLKM